MRRLLDLLVWAAVIAVTIGALMFVTPPSKVNGEPIPRLMSGPTVEEFMRARGEDPALFVE